jgi:eukaryotic-like serine/threonine-protein kinase
MHRRNLFRYIGTTVLGSLVTLRRVDIRAQSAMDVPMYRGNAARTGEMPGPGPAGSPSVRWRVELGGLIGRSTPAVVENVVYVGSDTGLWALDAPTGAELWRFEVPEDRPPRAVDSSPAVVDGVVYAVSYRGILYAVDATTGQERWRLDTVLEEPVQACGALSSPAVADGVVYLGTCDGDLLAVDANTGSERWRHPLRPRFLIDASPAVAGGMVYLGYVGVTAVDAVSGEQVWEAGEYVPVSSPAVADGVVYLGSGHDVYAFDAGSGEQRWHVETDFAMSSSPAVSQGVVYIGSLGRNVYAFATASGEELWRFVTPDDSLSASVTIADGVVYASGHNSGRVYALDADRGQELWRFDTGVTFRPASSPIVIDGTVYFHGGDGALYALA